MTTPKPSALDKYLSKSHRSWCKVNLFSLQKDRHCTCGRDAAIKQWEETKKRAEAVQLEFLPASMK